LRLHKYIWKELSRITEKGEKARKLDSEGIDERVFFGSHEKERKKRK